jgi:alpha-beta hydrolase superfamily lysophospholipase
MVEYAAYFHSKIVSNTLTGLPMPSGQDLKVGLLGHSVGAGLATYVAQQAAAQKRSFESVMYMAPQTEASAKVLGQATMP